MVRREQSSTTAWRRGLAGSLLAFVVSSCSGGSSESLVPGPDPPASEAQAARFLTRATFGPSHEDIHRLSVIGYAAWFDEQTRYAPWLERPTLEAWKNSGSNVSQDQRLMLWWKGAVQRPDQLRQRMAFALSEIFVISDVAGTLRDD